MTPQSEPAGALRMYVIVRREILPLVHCGVQAGHSAAEYVWFHRDMPSTRQWAENDRTMLFLEGTLSDLSRVMVMYSDRHMKFQPFYEPDMDNTLTAVAFQPVTKEDAAEYFGGLKLLR